MRARGCTRRTTSLDPLNRLKKATPAAITGCQSEQPKGDSSAAHRSTVFSTAVGSPSRTRLSDGRRDAGSQRTAAMVGASRHPATPPHHTGAYGVRPSPGDPVRLARSWPSVVIAADRWRTEPVAHPFQKLREAQAHGPLVLGQSTCSRSCFPVAAGGSSSTAPPAGPAPSPRNAPTTCPTAPAVRRVSHPDGSRPTPWPSGRARPRRPLPC